jgi:hypothetical protein
MQESLAHKGRRVAKDFIKVRTYQRPLTPGIGQEDQAGVLRQLQPLLSTTSR